jgi:hypothetical protein
VIVVLAFVVVLAIWAWAGTHAPAAEVTALHARCPHLPVLIGLQSTGESARPSHREATYLCVPDYFSQGLQYNVITRADAPVQVVISTSWKPLMFVAVLALMGGFFLYARRSNRASRPVR